MANHPRNSKQDDGLEQFRKDSSKQYWLIKHRLSTYRASLKPVPTYEALADKLKVSAATLRSVFTCLPDNEKKYCIEGESAPNLYIVLALCEEWGLDRAEVLAPDGEAISLTSKITHSSDAVYLSDSGYQGTFWGYMCSRSVTSKGVSSFKLSINKGADSISETATLEVFDPISSNGTLSTMPRRYVGTPIRLKNSKKVYIVFSNTAIDQEDKECKVDGAHFYIFCFNYSHYSHGLYYRKGIVITEDSKGDDMLVENFIIFKNPKEIDLSKNETQQTIRGLLSFADFSNDELYISERALEKFSESEQLREFIKKYEYNWLAHPTNGYYLKIEQVLGAVNKDTREELYNVIDSLLKIISQEKVCTCYSYKELDKLRIFIKEYLQDL